MATPVPGYPPAQLSKNFSLNEFTLSQKAVRYGWDNTPDEEQAANLQLLCAHVLQPLRDEVGPVLISSGFRAPRINRAVGGSKRSAHLRGCAADIYSNILTPHELAEAITRMFLPFQKLILEHNRWNHCQIDPLQLDSKAASKMVMCAYQRKRAIGKPKTIYRMGLVPEAGIWYA